MVKRPKVDNEALQRIMPDTESFANLDQPPEQEAQKTKDNGDLVQKITDLKTLIDKLSGLLETEAFEKLTCKDLQ